MNNKEFKFPIEQHRMVVALNYVIKISKFKTPKKAANIIKENFHVIPKEDLSPDEYILLKKETTDLVIKCLDHFLENHKNFTETPSNDFIYFVDWVKRHLS